MNKYSLVSVFSRKVGWGGEEGVEIRIHTFIYIHILPVINGFSLQITLYCVFMKYILDCSRKLQKLKA